MTKRQANAIDRQIGAIYHAHCTGIVIPIMKISDIYAAGRQAAADGRDVTQAVIGAARAIEVKP